MSVVLRKLLPPVVSPVKILCYPFFLCFLLFLLFYNLSRILIYLKILQAFKISRREILYFRFSRNFLEKIIKKDHRSKEKQGKYNNKFFDFDERFSAVKKKLFFRIFNAYLLWIDTCSDWRKVVLVEILQNFTILAQQ